jgi:membrane dipeptidase
MSPNQHQVDTPTSDAVILWDSHAGFSPFPDLNLDFLQRWRESGVSYLCVNVGYDTVMSWHDVVQCIAHFRHWIDTHPDTLLHATTVADVHRAKREGRLAIGFDLEGANALDGRLDMIGLYYHLGVRHMNFAYNKNNRFGGGCHDTDISLTDLGRKAVTEMNRVGMVIDCSHTGYTTSMDVMARSERPVIFSHSNPRALCDHPRNIRDDQIAACASTGGVIGINGVSTFLGCDEPTCDVLLRHVDYVVQKVGARHVGLGLDTVIDPQELPKLLMRFPDAWPGYSQEGMAKMVYVQPEAFLEFASRLSHRGYSNSDISGILGGNFLRVAAETWRNN